MHKGMKVLGLASLSLLMLVLGGVGGVAITEARLHTTSSTALDVPANAQGSFRLMEQAWNMIDQNYVDQKAVDPQTLSYGAISGMVNALGDTGHSRFLTPEMRTQEQNAIQGKFSGIGAEVQMKDGHVVIVAPLDGSPAQKAGVMPGDMVVKVDGEDVTGQPLEQVVSKILGKAGTQVTLTLQDPKTGTMRDVSITRAEITIHNVTWQMLPGTKVAHLRIAAFSQGVTPDLKKALGEIKDAGATGIVLDLRNDPGGLLDEAIGVTSQFLTSGDVLLEKDAKGNVTHVPVKSGALAPDLPMVVLINQGTASAAEIVSGALQDAGRAQLVGETTFGTGTVLQDFPLADGSSMLLATQEWLTPKGRVIWHQGIEPGQVVALPSGVVPLTPEGERQMTAADLKSSQDAQLLEGLKLLTQRLRPSANAQ
ncbi:MAG: S41 family peptidase [Anaerolineales bacterium]|jgi:carboxyl-terminal processing protease